MKPDAKDVTYLGEVLEKIQLKLNEAGNATMKKVLPGARRKVMKPLQEAKILLTSVEKVVKTSGMDKKLGFIATPDGIQPIESKPVKEPEDAEA